MVAVALLGGVALYSGIASYLARRKEIEEKGYDVPEPEPEGEDVAALLDAAEDIVNAAAPDIIDEFERKRPKRSFGRKNPSKRKKKK